MRKPIMVTLGVAALFAGPGAGAAWADFVCPVLPVPQQAKDHSQADFIPIGGGDTSILPGRAGDDPGPVEVPEHATNDDGAGQADGSHADPGDPGYTAIWNT